MDKNDFKEKLTALLNQFGVDNDCNMPDYLIAESVIRHLMDIADTNRGNMAWHGWKAGEDNGKWHPAVTERPVADNVLAHIMPHDEVRMVKVVNGKFIVDGGEMVSHWMDIPRF